MNRRGFLLTVAGAFAGLKLAPLTSFFKQRRALASTQGARDDLIPKRILGLTGREVSVFGLGGESTIQQLSRQDEAVAIIERALDLGVNYIDTSPTYGGGGSETNIGKVMARRRQEVFLSSKTHDRGYDGTMRLIEQSLKRLQTDHLNLYQVHNVRVKDDLERALGRNSAVSAMEKLKSQGVIHHIGITGHKDPNVLIQGIEGYDFDTILLTLNAGDIHHDPFQKELLQKAVAKQMGVIAMKITAVNQIVKPRGILTMKEALGYTFSFPVSTAIVGISSLEQVEENARIARDFMPFAKDELAALEQKVKPYQRQANFFKHDW